MKKMRIFHEVNTMPTYFLGIIKSIQGKLLPPRKPRRIQLFHFLLLFSFLFAVSFPQETAIFRPVFTSNPHRKSLRQCFRTFGRNLLSRFLPEKTGAAHDKGWRCRVVIRPSSLCGAYGPVNCSGGCRPSFSLTSFQRKNRSCKTQKGPAGWQGLFLKFVSQMVSADYLMSGKIRDTNSSQKPFSRFLPICPLWGSWVFTCVCALPGRRLRAATLLRLQSGEFPQSLRRNFLFGWCRLRQQAASQLSRLCAPAC